MSNAHVAYFPHEGGIEEFLVPTTVEKAANPDGGKISPEITGDIQDARGQIRNVNGDNGDDEIDWGFTD